MWEVIGLAICLFWATWKHRDCIVFFLLTFLSNSGARFFLITLAVGLLPLRDMTQGNFSGDEENTDTSHISPGQGIRLEQICRFHLPSSCDASQSTFCASSLIFFTIPLKYNDVTRQTEPDSDSAAEHTPLTIVGRSMVPSLSQMTGWCERVFNCSDRELSLRSSNKDSEQCTT